MAGAPAGKARRWASDVWWRAERQRGGELAGQMQVPHAVVGLAFFAHNRQQAVSETPPIGGMAPEPAPWRQLRQRVPPAAEPPPAKAPMRLQRAPDAGPGEAAPVSRSAPVQCAHTHPLAVVFEPKQAPFRAASWARLQRPLPRAALPQVPPPHRQASGERRRARRCLPAHPVRELWMRQATGAAATAAISRRAATWRRRSHRPLPDRGAARRPRSCGSSAASLTLVCPWLVSRLWCCCAACVCCLCVTFRMRHSRQAAALHATAWRGPRPDQPPRAAAGLPPAQQLGLLPQAAFPPVPSRPCPVAHQSVLPCRAPPADILPLAPGEGYLVARRQLHAASGTAPQPPSNPAPLAASGSDAGPPAWSAADEEGYRRALQQLVQLVRVREQMRERIQARQRRAACEMLAAFAACQHTPAAAWQQGGQQAELLMQWQHLLQHRQQLPPVPGLLLPPAAAWQPERMQLAAALPPQQHQPTLRLEAGQQQLQLQVAPRRCQDQAQPEPTPPAKRQRLDALPGHAPRAS